MFFLIPFIPVVVSAITAAQVAGGGALLVGGVAAGKALHDSGRRKGRKEGAETFLRERAQRDGESYEE
jgi:hypothetical protein